MWKDFGIPTRIARVSTDEELLGYINKWNGITNIYSSIYWYNVIQNDEYGNEKRQPLIDKVCFDIDNDLESAKKLTAYLLDKELKFSLFNSGRGWHFYIYCCGNGDAQKLRIAQLSILHESKASADMHLIGDVSRILRIPNSWNFKSNSFCIPIKVEELGKEDGSKQRIGQRFIYGNKILNLEDYTESNFEYIKPEIMLDMKINTHISLLPCIRNTIKKINPTQIERYALVVFLSDVLRNGKDLHYFDQGLLLEQIRAFFLENCRHWMDFNIERTMYQVKNILPKTNFYVGCKFLKEKGLCIECIPGGL